MPIASIGLEDHNRPSGSRCNIPTVKGLVLNESDNQIESNRPLKSLGSDFGTNDNCM
jgi:hypothetical protein